MKTAVRTIDQIKSYLDDFVGEPVYLRANIGRKRSFEAKGILEETYPKVFVVKLDETNGPRRQSYTYADILTNDVELKPIIK